MTATEAEAPVTAPRYQLSERGRRAWHSKIDALDGGFYLVRQYGGRATAAWPVDRGQAGGNLPRLAGESYNELLDMGLNPREFYVARGAAGYFEPFVPPTPVDRATYPDLDLAHLPLYRVTRSQDSFLADLHRDALFRGAPGADDDPDRISLLIPIDSTYREDGLSFMYESRGAVLERAGIDRSRIGHFRQYNIQSGRYERVDEGTITVTATPEVVDKPVEAMSKKELRAALEAVQAAHTEDMRKVSARLQQEAETRRWCDTYDRVVRDLSADLKVPLQPRREKRARRVTFNLVTPRVESISMFADLTPEETVTEVQAWVRRNLGAAATASDITVE